MNKINNIHQRTFNMLTYNKYVNYAQQLKLAIFLFEPITAKWRLLGGVPLFDALVRGEPLHPVAENFVTIN